MSTAAGKSSKKYRLHIRNIRESFLFETQCSARIGSVEAGPRALVRRSSAAAVLYQRLRAGAVRWSKSGATLNQPPPGTSGCAKQLVEVWPSARPTSARAALALQPTPRLVER